MKITLTEHGACFCLEFEAESLKDASTLVRLARNGLKDIRAGNVSAHEDGVSGYITIGKRKDPRNRAAFNLGAQV